ncbi:hypothetical protein AB0G92_27010, partial [Streptomyces californicus]
MACPVGQFGQAALSAVRNDESGGLHREIVEHEGARTALRGRRSASGACARTARFVNGVPRTHLEEAMRVARWQG